MINTDNDLPYRGKQGRLITFSFAAGALKDLTIDDIDLFTTVFKAGRRGLTHGNPPT